MDFLHKAPSRITMHRYAVTCMSEFSRANDLMTLVVKNGAKPYEMAASSPPWHRHVTHELLGLPECKQGYLMENNAADI